MDKSFEHTIRFLDIQTDTGERIRLPLVAVTLVQPNGNRVHLPLLFDTGADVTTLRHDLFHLLGVSSWDSGEPRQTLTAGGPQPVTVYRYDATLEFLGKTVTCPIHLAPLPPNTPYFGLFGRDQLFGQFGFGFWEKDHELYVTESP